MKFPFVSKRIFLRGLLGIGIIALASLPAIFFYMKYQDAQTQLKNPNDASKKEAEAIIAKVARHLVLPEEVPTVATVSDSTKLKDQAFFSSAQNGDRVLLYTQAKKAVLYRPSVDRVIEVSTVNIGDAAPEVTTPSTSIALYNGTSVVGLTKKYEASLLEKIPSATVVTRANATSKSYAKTILIDLTGQKEADAVVLAGQLGIAVEPLPKGEVAPTNPASDFLIILGTDSVK